MILNLTPELEQTLINEDWRVLFHGTCREFKTFGEDSIGQGGDDNSALGVHFAEFPQHAADYAKGGAMRSEGDPQILIVLVPAHAPIEERDYYRFFGFDAEGNPDQAFGKPGFARWRQELLEQGHDVVDYEDGEGPITVALDPSTLQIVGSMTIDEAHALGERLDLEDDQFCPARRIAVIREAIGPAVARAPSLKSLRP